MTLPVELREVMDIHDGDVVEFELLAVVRRKNGTSDTTAVTASVNNAVTGGE